MNVSEATPLSLGHWNETRSVLSLNLVIGKHLRYVTNSSLILAQRILDVFDEAQACPAERESSLEVALVIVREARNSTSRLLLTDEPDPEDQQLAS